MSDNPTHYSETRRRDIEWGTWCTPEWLAENSPNMNMVSIERRIQYSEMPEGEPLRGDRRNLRPESEVMFVTIRQPVVETVYNTVDGRYSLRAIAQRDLPNVIAFFEELERIPNVADRPMYMVNLGQAVEITDLTAIAHLVGPGIRTFNAAVQNQLIQPTIIVQINERAAFAVYLADYARRINPTEMDMLLVNHDQQVILMMYNIMLRPFRGNR